MCSYMKYFCVVLMKLKSHVNMFFLSWNTECLISCLCFLCRFLSHRETNLKVKQALTVTGDMGDSLEALAAFNGEEKERENFLL